MENQNIEELLQKILKKLENIEINTRKIKENSSDLEDIKSLVKNIKNNM